MRVAVDIPDVAQVLRERFDVFEKRYPHWYEFEDVRADSDDAALLDPKREALVLLPREPLTAIQKRQGIVPVLGQLHRSVPELYRSVQQTRGISFPPLKRDSDGRWTVVSQDGRMSCDGRSLENGDTAPVQTGSRLTWGEESWLFLEEASLWPRFCERRSG